MIHTYDSFPKRSKPEGKTSIPYDSSVTLKGGFFICSIHIYTYLGLEEERQIFFLFFFKKKTEFKVCLSLLILN